MSSQLSIEDAKQQMKCAVCSKEACVDIILKSCGACYSVNYCSSTCQRAGWKTHKAECNQKKVCAGCGKKACADLVMKSCSACHSVSYCGSDCQASAWKEHRPLCNQLKANGIRGAGVMGSSPPPTAPLSSTVERYDGENCFKACFEGRVEDLQKVLEQGAIDINWAHPDTGATAVFFAAQQGYDKCLALLIRHGADLSKMINDGDAPIHAACLKGRVACLSLLLDNGINADVRTRDVHGFTPVATCCLGGHVKCLALLLDRGSDPNLSVSCDNSTAVHVACTYGQLKCLQLLIARGANFNALDSSGDTPLDVARRNDHVDCVELLIENHALGQRAEDIIPISEAQEQINAGFRESIEASKEDAKRCDYPPCNASAADKNLSALMKCPKCGEGRYCCHMHGILDWDRHKLLCKDIKLKVEIEAQH